MVSRLSELIDVARGGFLIDLPECPTIADILGARNKAGDGLLHVACARGSKEEVNILLGIGMPINEIGDYGYTPLHYAAEAQSMEIFNLLVARGADETIKNIYGDSAFELFL